MFKATKGSIVACALAGVFATACSKSDGSKSGSAEKPATMEAKVKCQGVNACAGHGACKSAANDCAGKNGCKGKGFVEMTKEECDQKGGKVM
jgi:hypothetical protein